MRDPGAQTIVILAQRRVREAVTKALVEYEQAGMPRPGTLRELGEEYFNFARAEAIAKKLTRTR